MSDLDLLLRAILLGPSDDFPRLQYADALEEAGDAARAEVIRGGIYTERLGVPDGPCKPGCPCGGVGNRVAELIDRHGDEWNPPLPGEVPGKLEFSWRRGFVEAASLPCADFMRHAEALFNSHPIASVTLTDREAYHANGRWTFTRFQQEFHAANDFADVLPSEIFDLLSHPYDPGYNTWQTLSEGAWELALSRACVLYGRRLAGLPLESAPARAA